MSYVGGLGGVVNNPAAPLVLPQWGCRHEEPMGDHRGSFISLTKEGSDLTGHMAMNWHSQDLNTGN